MIYYKITGIASKIVSVISKNVTFVNKYYKNIFECLDPDKHCSPGAIVKNQAPHVNFCYSVVLRSYGCRVSEKKWVAFFSNNVQGHLEVIEGHEFRHLTDFINNAYRGIKIFFVGTV